MKRNIKITALLLILALAAAAIACSSAETELTTPAPMETEAKPNGDVAGEIIDPNAPKFEAEFFRIAYEYEGGKAKPVVITNAADFASVVLPNLSGETKDAACAKYGEDFFKNHHLIVFKVVFSSGSVIPEVTGVELADGTVTVNVGGRMDGDVGTCDMAEHLGIVALDNLHWPVDAPVSVVPPAAANNAAGKEK
jgi:hypothetical protein